MENIERHETVHNGCGCECGCESSAGQETAVERHEQKAPRRAYVPAVDIIESESAVELVVDVPGVAEDSVDLTIEKSVLTISAVPADGVIAGKKLMYAEYGVGEYRRSFTLAEEIDQEHISASLKNGVLRVKLPKSASVTRKISVSGE